jgi:hypothetical protein
MFHTRIMLIENFLPDPEAYRAKALTREFRTFEFPEVGVTFHGINVADDGAVPLRLAEVLPGATPTLSFLRRSPAGQVEPHYIHTDADMGDWTGLLYLNPDPPLEDGTSFWQHVETGELENKVPHARSVEGRSAFGWREWWRCEARFNRMLIFPSTYFHSRAIYGNWGAGDDARLTQVTFGRGNL